LEYTDLLRERFAWVENNKQDSNYPCVWEKKPNFWFWDSDYRTVRVYNMPALISTDRKDGFLRDSLRLFLDAREVSEISNKIAKKSGIAVGKIFADMFKNKLVNSDELKAIAKFLGIDENTAMDCFLLAFGMSSISKTLHGVSIIASLLDNFGMVKLFGGPAGVVLAAALDIACFTTTKSALLQEKTLNYAEILSTVYNMLLNKQDHRRILDSNVLVTAVDERDFNSLIRWSAFRRNDGSWCDFVYIGGLKCAPNAKDYYGGKVIPVFSELYGRILHDGNLDYDEIRKFVKTGVMHVDHFFSEKKEETSESSSSSSSPASSNAGDSV
jgi:hypothetical protein